MADSLQYQDQLLLLKPPGLALPTEGGTMWSKLMGALGIEFSRVDGRMADLTREASPLETYELLEEWEESFGLPDSCVVEEQTVDQRRRALILRYSMTGGASPQYFIDLAAYLGFTITVESIRPPTVDDMRIGDRVYSDDWAYVFIIHAPEVTVSYLEIGGAVGERLASFGNEVLECNINRVKPAHSLAIFAYDLALEGDVPDGFIALVDSDGTYLTDNDNAQLMEAI